MDSESRAAADLLAALCRAAEEFASLRHAYIRREPLSRLDPGKAVTGVDFILPDGRIARFAVSFSTAGDFFHVEGEISVEERVLLDLPKTGLTDVREALVVFQGYVREVVSRASWLLDDLIDELTAS